MHHNFSVPISFAKNVVRRTNPPLFFLAKALVDATATQYHHLGQYVEVLGSSQR
jgi:hypothetical protein